jgi:hypothetical protein
VASTNVSLAKLVAQPDGRVIALGTADDGVVARIWP